MFEKTNYSCSSKTHIGRYDGHSVRVLCGRNDDKHTVYGKSGEISYTFWGLPSWTLTPENADCEDCLMDEILSRSDNKIT